MNLVQTIYVSSATHELDAEEIRQILDSSIRHNASQQVTGMLLYSEGSFMQVLEGEATAVEETMARILKDPRHHGVNELSRSAITEREFGSWTMGFRGIKAADAKAWPGYAHFFEYGFDAGTIASKPGVALEILKIFATQR